jgi:predicted AAA+ superfamily ATPase
MYIKRHGADAINKLANTFGAILVTGARQVGKTTLLQATAGNLPYVTLDDPIMLTSANTQSGTFLKDNPPPLVIDEIQYAPNLFPQIKMAIDSKRQNGLFYMSGSQQFKMMKNVSESLAGRLGILNLLGLSLREITGVDFTMPFIPTDDFLDNRRTVVKNVDYLDVWEKIWRGSMPQMYAEPNTDWRMFYGAYVKTYIERDVRDLTQVGDELKFMQFMTVLAGMTGSLLNLASVARNVGVSHPTAERWLSVLTASNIVYLLQPYSNNMLKRAVKTPKIYFLDTGLAAYLTKWSNPDVLRNGAMAGAFWESFVVAEIIKSYYNAGVLDLPLYFYRDKDMKEIDLLINADGILYPIEIKKHADPSLKDAANFSVLDKINGITRGQGVVICGYDKLVSLSENVKCLPITWL